MEKEEFCARFQGSHDLSGGNHTFHGATCAEEQFDTERLRILLALTIMVAYGALIRTILRVWKLDIPYTVVLFLSGMLAGVISKSFCSTFETYTAIGRLAGQVYLFCFLPVLIFESAFAIRPHIFMRSVIQILLVALVGMAIATFLTAIFVQLLLIDYKWTYLEASLFGSIVSATDPVAVVAILRELGVSETLTVLIEGESLLNDGVAVLLFEVLEEITACEVHENFGVFTLKKFCQVTLGGPAFGYLMGKVTVQCLSMVHTDMLVETSISLASAYLVYYIGEEVLGVSGIMALVVLGISVGFGNVYFSPRVVDFVQEFWEYIGYLANTILFIIVGIIVTETAFNEVTSKDWLYLLILYVIAHVVRVAMLLIMFPLLSRFGYRLKWKDTVVMAWAGLRGAVGLCLALEIFEKKEFCGSNLGPKFLFQMSGLVLLTMVVNATTFKMLLKVLKLTDTPSSKVCEMNETIKLLNTVGQRVLSSLKTEPFSKGAEWTLVSRATTIANPYNINKPGSVNRNSVADESRLASSIQLDVGAQLSGEELRTLKKDARLAVLRTFRVSLHQQFHQGLLSEPGMQFLLNVVNMAEDNDFHLIRAEELKRYWRWQRRPFWSKLKKLCLKIISVRECREAAEGSRIRKAVSAVGASIWFDIVILLIVLGHLIPSIWDCVLLARGNTRTFQFGFFICNIVFLILYIIELLVKLVSEGPWHYFRVDLFNYIDIAVIIVLVTDVVFYSTGMVFNSIYILVKLIPSSVSLLSRLILSWMDNHAHWRLFVGYQIGRSFIVAADQTVQMIPRTIRHVKLIPKLIRVLESEKLKIVEELDLMNKYHPDIVRAAKSHEATKKVLHQMLQSLDQTKEEGLLDSQEYELIVEALLEVSRKSLSKIQTSAFQDSPSREASSFGPRRRFYHISTAFRVFRAS